MAASGKHLVSHVPGAGPARMIRSTVLQSSLATLRQRGHFERWSATIDPAARSTILDAIGPSWLDISLGHAHYRACEALELSQEEQVALGEAVGDRIQGSFLGTLARSARVFGLTPLVLLSQFDRLYGRLFQGGSVQLTSIGPKDVLGEVRELPLVQYGYFRTAFSGVVRAGILLAGVKSCQVTPRAYQPATQTFVMHATWA